MLECTNNKVCHCEVAMPQSHYHQSFFDIQELLMMCLCLWHRGNLSVEHRKDYRVASLLVMTV